MPARPALLIFFAATRQGNRGLPLPPVGPAVRHAAGHFLLCINSENQNRNINIGNAALL